MNTGLSRAARSALCVSLATLAALARTGDARAQQLGAPPQVQPVFAPPALAQPPSAAPEPMQPIGVRARVAVPVHFIAYRGEDPYVVHAGEQHCSTPCTMVLPSGPHAVRTTGAAEFTTQLVVPHLPAQVRLFHGAPYWYSVAGTILIPTGIVVGASMWALGIGCGYGSGSGGCQAANFIIWPVVGVTMLVTGSVLVAAANRAPPADANRAEILDASARPRVRFTGLALGPTNGGFGAALSLAF